MKIDMKDHLVLSTMVQACYARSTRLTTDPDGNVVSQLRYSAWGSVRYQAGNTPTEYTFTGQYGYDFGLMYFNARWLDVSISHFAQADTVIPGAGNPQAWGRYTYAMNNPVLYDDPDGHCPVCGAAVGATLGALTTAVLYTVNNQRTFDVTEYETAVVAGAIAGGLIGSGVGILAASGTIASQVATASSLIGGGMSASLTETSYILGNAEEFETTPFLLQGATSAAAGAVTSNPGASLGAKGLSNVIAAETSYFTTGERHSLEGAFMTGAWAGMLTSLQYGVDFLAEDTLMINRPIQSDLSLLKAASSSIGSQNIRTIFYGSSSGLLTNFGIAGGQSIAHKLDRRDQ